MKNEKFSSFINQLPSLLKNGWKVYDEGQIEKNSDSEKSYLICEHTGSEIDKVLICIDLEEADVEGHAYFKLVTQHRISDQKILASVLKDFENMLKRQGCCIEICLEEDDEGKFITFVVECEDCEKTLYSDQLLVECPYCGNPFFTITRSEPRPSVVPNLTVNAMYEREKNALECLLNLDTKGRCDFIQEPLQELDRTCRGLYPNADHDLTIKFLRNISMWAMKCDGDLNDDEVNFLESFLNSSEITEDYSVWHFTGYTASKAKEELSTSVFSAKFNTTINHINPEINYFPFMKAIFTIFGAFATADKKIYNETAEAFYELNNLFK